MSKLPATKIREVRHAVVMAALLAVGATGAANAQEAGIDSIAGDTAIERTQGSVSDLLVGLRSIANLDVTVGADGRPHRALRFRFDSATRAMRSFGVEADSCSTVLRSSNRSSGVIGESSRPGLTVALNCRFF